MKSIIAILAAVALTASVQAQQYNTTTVTVTNLIAAVSTNTVNTGSFTATKNGEVAVTVSAQLTAAGAGNSEIVLATGVDGTTYAGPTHTILLAQAGTLSASVTSNLNLGALGYIRIKTLGNSDNDGVLSNMTISYTVKPNRQDGK